MCEYQKNVYVLPTPNSDSPFFSNPASGIFHIHFSHRYFLQNRILRYKPKWPQVKKLFDKDKNLFHGCGWIQCSILYLPFTISLYSKSRMLLWIQPVTPSCHLQCLLGVGGHCWAIWQDSHFHGNIDFSDCWRIMGSVVLCQKLRGQQPQKFTFCADSHKIPNLHNFLSSVE